MSAAVEVPVGDLRAHPDNPRVGDVKAIADSLRVNGQYRPVVVNRGSLTGRPNELLAGTHTWKAAKSLGWPTVGATYVDVDSAQAIAILLADNKASDSGHTVEADAMALLQALPDIDGTGYSMEDLRLPEPEIESTFTPGDEGGEEGGTPSAPAAEKTSVPMAVGNARGTIAKAHFDEWRKGYPSKAPAAFAAVCGQLGLTEEPTPAAPRLNPLLDVQEEYIDSLIPYPGNPRQGDVGMLTELLKAHGQFKPIVVSKNTRRILAGNHVALAAQALGWDRVAVSWVTVDEDGERRIVLADNRTSDLAQYDTAALGRALTAVSMEQLERTTGYALEDVQALLNGDTPAKPVTRAEATIRIGNIKGKVRLGLLQDLNLTPGYELQEVAAILHLEGVQ